MLTPLLLALVSLNAIPQAADADAQAVERLNVIRKAAGLGPVTLDPTLSKGCAAHAEYLGKNSASPAVQGAGMHKEDPKLPGFSEEGAKAGAASVVMPTGSTVAAVDIWMASLFHRVPLLDPQLTKVGVGFGKGGKFGGYVVLDCLHGRERESKGPGQPIVYPPDKAKDVPLKFAPEYPEPIPLKNENNAGYPVTVSFADEVAVRDATVTLKDGAGKEVAGWLSTPSEPAAGQKVFQRNTICLIAKAPLKANVTYTVTVKATVNDKAWTQTWTFTTARK